MKTNDIGNALEIRRGTIERIENAQAQYFKVTGEIQTNLPGEAIQDVTFPVFFVDKPRMSYGSELYPGQAVQATLFPTCSVSTLTWDQRVRDDGTIIYAGATLGIVTTGPTDLVMIIQWHFEGVGLRGPAPDE